jgi:DNA adenine methylase
MTGPRPRPLVRYHGGKWMLAPWIIQHLPAHRVYVEPYGGGASVLLRKPRSYAEIYNDLESEIVNLFRVARDRGPELARALELTPFAREEFEQSYKPTGDPFEQARRTVARSFMGFGSASTSKQPSGFRSSSNNSGTTPAHNWRNYPAALTLTIERLRGVVIENRDAAEVMRRHDGPDTLHYVDPPYMHSTRSFKGRHAKRHSYVHEMTDAEHVDLAGVLQTLQGFVVLSGYPSPVYDALYHGWKRVDRAAFADGALPRTESLWLSPRASVALGLP